MGRNHLVARLLVAGIGCASVIGAFTLSTDTRVRAVNDTIWVANRSANTIRGFDAASGEVVGTVAMASNSQPGDLAYAKGKLYVTEEFGAPPAIAVVDVETGEILKRIPFPSQPPFLTSWRPHHVHASVGGNLVAAGLYGTDMVAVIDTRDDSLIGPWDSNPLTTNGRVHAGVFSNDGNTLYLTSDASNEVIAIDPRTGYIFWRMTVPGAHELALTHDGKHAFVSRRTANKLAVIDLENQTFQDVLTLGLPDSLQLSANEKLLTVGLRTSPAQLAVVDTDTFTYELVNLSPEGGPSTLAGHQWTSPSGRVTFAAFEGGTGPGIAVIDHRAGNEIVQTLAYPGRPHGVDRALP
jgi:DNA-binding beta-propeller fold protein YncE